MDIRKLITQGESQTVEFKSSLQWDVEAGRKNKDLRFAVLKTIAAFLNTEGGTLLIGVQDDGSVFGLEKDLELLGGSRDRFEQTVANLIRRYLGAQFAPFITTRFARVEGHTVYVVQVQPAPEPAYLQTDKGRAFFVRMGTTSPPLDVAETHKYILAHWGPSGRAASATPSSPEAAMSQPFHTIAVPHEDIWQGRFTLETFAADLWKVAHKQGPEAYWDAELFFRQTYPTRGLQHLYDVVGQRLRGRGGASVIQLQTPFGGGKTHALIALYHKAQEWGANPVVVSGTALSGRETLWGLMAEQLTGARAGFEEPTSPGRAKLEALLREHEPVLVLMDEVLEYMTKAAGVMVGKTTLADQTLAFLQELTEAAATMARVVVVLTLPSSLLEHYGEQATHMFEQLKKISGRVETVFTPVDDSEVGAIIRQRLFASVNDEAAAQVVNAFVEQAEREGVLPRGEESVAYRERFKQTYPFLPEVVDVLYHRWGSFPTFQRTRGTLRLLALVVGALLDSSRPYISLADFDLTSQEIRRELLKHIESAYDSVLAADITGDTAGARRVNREIGRAYRGLRLGERVATTIFMYSHVGGKGEAGATLAEIKRQNLMSGVPASIIAEVLQKLSNRLLFYLHEHNGRYYFTTTANLNRALTIRMENVTAEELQAAEYDLLRKVAGDQRMATYIWPTDTADIPDNEAPKLVILPTEAPERMMAFRDQKGQTPRVNRNTLFFLTPLRAARANFDNLLRRHLAYQELLEQETLSLTAEQRKRLERDAKRTGQDLHEQILNLYRLLYLPAREGWDTLDLGTPTFGSGQKLNERVYETLHLEKRLLEKLAPLVIKERFLADRPFVETVQLAQSGPRTPGEILAVGRQAWEQAIAEGVRQGLFGLGVLDDEGRPRCLYFKQTPTVSLEGREVILRADLCQQEAAEPSALPGGDAAPSRSIRQPAGNYQTTTLPGWGEGGTATETTVQGPTRQQLTLRFALPFGQASSLLGLFNLLQHRFKTIEITIQLRDGEISEADIESKIRETFRQIGTDVDVE